MPDKLTDPENDILLIRIQGRSAKELQLDLWVVSPT